MELGSYVNHADAPNLAMEVAAVPAGGVGEDGADGPVDGPVDGPGGAAAEAACPWLDLRLTFRALRDVGKGEELSISYCDPALGEEEKRTWLQQHYFF